MAKRGQGLPLNIIILAIIALVVLAVLVIIFTRNVDDINSDLKQCSLRGGACSDKVCNPDTQQTLQGTECKAPKPYCCLTVLKGGS